MATDYIEVPLTRGKVALISPCDSEMVLNHRWCATPARSGLWYAVRSCVRNGKRTTESMHRFILGATREVDHADGNGLNNQRHNIREVSRNVNKHRRKPITSSSGFRGVCKFHGKFAAYITSNRKTKYLGLFKDAVTAANAYDDAATELHGYLAMRNFPVW